MGRKGPGGHQVHTPGKEPDVCEEHWAPSPLGDARTRDADAFRTAIRTLVQVHYLLFHSYGMSSLDGQGLGNILSVLYM